MRKLSTCVFVVLSLIVPALSFSQSTSPVWFTLNAPEGSIITASSPVTVRFGQVTSTCAVVMNSGPCSATSAGAPSPEAWTSPETFTPARGSASISIVVSSDTFGGVDPLPGVYKTVQIQEQANPQSITVNGQQVAVPGLSTSPSSPPSSGSWFTLNAPEGSVITASGSISLRYGQAASTCATGAVSSGPCQGASPGTPTPEAWTSPQTFSPSGSSTVSVLVGTSTFNNVDPLPGVYKTVQIQQKTTDQTIIVNGQSITVPGTSSSSASGTWFTLDASEGSVITASAAIILRYGQVASTCSTGAVSSGPCQGASSGTQTPETWTSPKTFSPPSGSPTVRVTVSTATFNNVDPLPGVYKTVQIQEQANPQTITVNGQSVTVPGTSTQTTCQLTANPTSISFRNTTVGYTLASSGSITSNCASTITVNSAQASGPYSLQGFQTPFSLASGQTQNYTAVFAPITAGTANGTISFASNATTNPNVSVSLSGTGVASSPSNHSVTLSWGGSSSQVSGYNLYRSTVSGGAYSKINSSLITTLSYTDQTAVGGSTYYYTVTAVGTNGMQSAYSNEVKVIIPSP